MRISAYAGNTECAPGAARSRRASWSRRARVHSTHLVLLVLWLLCFAGMEAARGEEGIVPPAASERSVKAAFLFKFLTYVEWPELAFSAPEAPIVIGVVNADDIAAELSQITASRTVNGRPVVVRRVREGESFAGLHVLYIGRSEPAHVASLVRAVQQRPVLTVSDVRGGSEHGVMINFVVVEGRVRFEIATEPAERSGLKLSSRLLSVAQNVRPGM